LSIDDCESDRDLSLISVGGDDNEQIIPLGCARSFFGKISRSTSETEDTSSSAIRRVIPTRHLIKMKELFSLSINL